MLFEAFLVREAEAGRLVLPLGAVAAKAVVHGHCHQKSFGAFKPVEKVQHTTVARTLEQIEAELVSMLGRETADLLIGKRKIVNRENVADAEVVN